ncbi:MAG: site-specific integrase, partial [Calditrichaeota bacterium]|nr:site-specific integrase [Calditrichota bacterium]
ERKTVSKGLTLQDAFDEYMDFIRAHRKPRTVEQYEWKWRKHLEDWSAGRGLKQIRRKDVTALHLRLGNESGHHMANRVMALLRAVINRAIREHELEIPNPAAGVTFFKESSRSRRLLIEELPHFFKAVKAEPNGNIRDFVMLALFTGVRKATLLAMRWDHIRLEQGLWVIPAVESKTGEEPPVVLSHHVIEILKARRERVAGPYVFPGERGAPHMMDPKMGWKRILERAGLENLRMHDLRRSLASFQIDTGTPLEVIQKTLGHENKATTEIYARMAMEPVRASLEVAIEEMIRQGNE